MKNWRKSFVLIMVVCFSVGMLAACTDNAENAPIEPVSEVISEEVPVAEPSEVEEESISEEISEETGGVEYFDFASYDEFFAYLTELNRTAIVDYDFSKGAERQAIIPNSAKYTLEGEDRGLAVISANKSIVDVKTNVDYIDASMWDNTEWTIYFDTIGTDLEVSFTVVYEDGTEEDFTICVTTSGVGTADASQEVEIVNYTNYDDFFAYLKERNQTTIVYYNFSSEDNIQAILPNNSKYTLLYEDISMVMFYPNKKVLEIKIDSDYIRYMESSTKYGEQIWSITIETTGTDIEVPVTINYEDGTVEEYTVYITTAGQ